MKNLLLLVCLAFVFASNAFAQSAGQSGVIKTATGVLIVWNQPGDYYTIEIKGLTIDPIPDRTLWFQVDGRFFQVLTIEKKQFISESDKSGTDDEAILTAHAEWESDYIGKTLNSKLKVDKKWMTFPNGMKVLAWSFEMPRVAENQTAKKQLYLTVVKRDRILLLNSVVETNDDENVTAKRLADTMSTLTPSDKPIDFKKAQEQVRKAN